MSVIKVVTWSFECDNCKDCEESSRGDLMTSPLKAYVRTQRHAEAELRDRGWEIRDGKHWCRTCVLEREHANR